MEIVRERAGDVLHVRVSGRLDNHWSEPFDEAIEEMLREGALHLRLDLSSVNYLSSAAVGALMKAYRDTTALQGTFRITTASDRVRTILRLVDLESLLFGSAEAAPAAAESRTHELRSVHAIFETHLLARSTSEWRLCGDPSALLLRAYAESDASPIAARRDLYAVGVGALGQSYGECRGLFGEFLAAAGAACYTPTDGTSTPDYMTHSGELVAEVQALYAVSFEGRPAHLLRFEATTPGGAVPLSEIVSIAAEVASTPRFGLVIAAGVSGLVCATLRRSPDHGPARVDFPDVREWLAFTPEREHARTSCLVVGFASSRPEGRETAFVRPVAEGVDGHFHAAVTSFRSHPRGRLDLDDVVAHVFQPRNVLAVVHLLRDDRPIEGAGESEFLRGACWVFPISRGGAEQ